MASEGQPQPNASRPRAKRRMTESELAEYRRRRAVGACKKCAQRKRKCVHALQESEQPSASRLAYRTNTDGEAICAICRERLKEGDLTARARHRHNELDEGSVLPASNAEYLGEALRIHTPQSQEARAIMLLIESIACEGADHSWFDDVPSRLGHDLTLDACTGALQHACWYRRKLPGVTLEKCFATLAEALEALKISVTENKVSDHTAAAVAAIAPADAVRSGHALLNPGHLNGLMAILKTLAARGPMTLLARRVLEYSFCDAFVLAAVRGISSPLESIDPYEYRGGYDDLTPPEPRLRRIGNELCVRLPRFIKLAREACVSADPEAIFAALECAQRLVALADDAGEAEFMEFIPIAKTTDPSDAVISQRSFLYRSLPSFEAGIYYWTTRMSVLRLCQRLRLYFPDLCDRYGILPVSQALAIVHQYGRNVVMSAEYAHTLRARKRKRLFSYGLIACWGVLRDHPDILIAVSGGIVKLRAWLTTNVNKALVGKEILTEKDMDDAAELFVGGLLANVYKDLYETPMQ